MNKKAQLLSNHSFRGCVALNEMKWNILIFSDDVIIVSAFTWMQDSNVWTHWWNVRVNQRAAVCFTWNQISMINMLRMILQNQFSRNSRREQQLSNTMASRRKMLALMKDLAVYSVQNNSERKKSTWLVDFISKMNRWYCDNLVIGDDSYVFRLPLNRREQMNNNSKLNTRRTTLALSSIQSLDF